MTDTRKRQPGPIEVWLSKANIQVTCTIVREDETTTSLEVDSLSMRGAQREITGYLISLGYSPAGRWETEQQATDGHFTDALECVRNFKPESVTDPI